MELTRHPDNPILLPEPASPWECTNVFNPGVLYHNGLFHMFYRCLLYTSPSPRDRTRSRLPSSA